jgi:hypothetical protein
MDNAERSDKRRLTVKRIQGNRNEAMPFYLSPDRLLRHDRYAGTIFDGFFDVFYVVEFGNNVYVRSVATKISV